MAVCTVGTSGEGSKVREFGVLAFGRSCVVCGRRLATGKTEVVDSSLVEGATAVAMPTSFRPTSLSIIAPWDI